MADREATRARLSELARLYPFPDWEIQRTKRREWILAYMRPGGGGAEVGVFRGHFSECLARVLRPRRFYLIDPWTKKGEFFGCANDYTNNGTLPRAIAREDAVLKAQLFPGPMEIVVIEDFFPPCAHRITDRLDWIYLDTGHEYESTMQELHGADKLIIDNGIIFGDDWQADPAHVHHGVFRAVNAFVKSNDYEIIAAGPEGQWAIRRLTRYAP